MDVRVSVDKASEATVLVEVAELLVVEVTTAMSLVLTVGDATTSLVVISGDAADSLVEAGREASVSLGLELEDGSLLVNKVVEAAAAVPDECLPHPAWTWGAARAGAAMAKDRSEIND